MEGSLLIILLDMTVPILFSRIEVIAYIVIWLRKCAKFLYMNEHNNMKIWLLSVAKNFNEYCSQVSWSEKMSKGKGWLFLVI